MRFKGLGQHRGWALLICCCGWAQSSVGAEPAPHTEFGVDIGYGQESQSSPLFQISPESTILYLPGAQSLKNQHWRIGFQGTMDVPLAQGWSATLSTNGQFKQAMGAPDMDFATLALSPALHRTLGSSSLGAAVNLQEMAVGGERFRTVRGLQLDWTLPQDQALWAVVVTTSSYRHPGDLAPLDAQETSVVILRQYQKPFQWLDGLDLSAIVGRERNRWGYDELSSRSRMLSATLRWTWQDVTCSVVKSWRQVNFAGSSFPMEPVRADHTSMTDVSLETRLNDKQSLRLELNLAHNASSTRLYNNRFQQSGISFIQTF